MEQLELDLIDNSNIKGLHLGKKGVHLNKKGKQRLELNFLGKLRNLWWSTEHLENKGLEQSIKNKSGNCDSSINPLLSSESSIKEPNAPYSKLHELRKNNPFRVIIGHLNINSIRNKFDPLKEIFKDNIDILLVSETKLD